ncbi:hypothetical protein PSEUDO9AG_40054 [Pseudomonas sp. 9Ag]|nr:hypothetical protein PSEUDO9AG_40054 [Pseudomonas sp. 9Ag]
MVGMANSLVVIVLAMLGATGKRAY